MVRGLSLCARNICANLFKSVIKVLFVFASLVNKVNNFQSQSKERGGRLVTENAPHEHFTNGLLSCVSSVRVAPESTVNNGVILIIAPFFL